MRAWVYQYLEAVEETHLAGPWVYEDWGVRAREGAGCGSVGAVSGA